MRVYLIIVIDKTICDFFYYSITEADVLQWHKDV